jgi:hypothetical protein
MKLYKPFFYLSLLALCFTSCKKEDPAPTSNFDFVVSPGSWWVYQWVEYVENGTAQASELPNDTVRITSEIEMEGKTWAILNSNNEAIDVYMRSKNGLLIIYPNNILFNSNKIEDTLTHYNLPGLEVTAITASSMEEITVPAGLFDCISTDIHFNITDRDSANINACTDFWIGQNTYAAGVGIISFKIPLQNNAAKPCGYMEQQLIDFYVAP